MGSMEMNGHLRSDSMLGPVIARRFCAHSVGSQPQAQTSDVLRWQNCHDAHILGLRASVTGGSAGSVARCTGSALACRRWLC
jgi:hypothetical protein